MSQATESPKSPWRPLGAGFQGKSPSHEAREDHFLRRLALVGPIRSIGWGLTRRQRAALVKYELGMSQATESPKSPWRPLGAGFQGKRPSHEAREGHFLRRLASVGPIRSIGWGWTRQQRAALLKYEINMSQATESPKSPWRPLGAGFQGK